MKDVNLGLTICEDTWFPEPVQQCVKAGADIIISLNASPFDVHKAQLREKTIKQRVNETKRPHIFIQPVGGQDEIVFDGQSFVLNEKNQLCYRSSSFDEELISVDVQLGKLPKIIPGNIVENLTRESVAYKALTIGLRDYVEKNNFPGVLIGLSGGVDSALVCTLAVDALGAKRVSAIFMPSRYTATMSGEDAETLAKNLGVKFKTISIEPLFEVFLTTLHKEFENTSTNITEENIQARIRGTILMALSNKFGDLVLTTGNKSEMAMGYATLYGDMAGGFAVLKDVYKSFVYDLVAYRNAISLVIPERIINRPPSAELAFGQTDQDSLPPYPILDQILERYVEYNESIEMIIASGFDKEIVRKAILLVNCNEYKRRQSPLGVKITTRAFGRDRRHPITNGFVAHLQ